MARLVLLVLLVSHAALAGQRLLQNDHFTGAGSIFSGVSFREYQGAGVLFTPSLSDYPLKIIAVDVLAVSYSGGASGSQGVYVIDVWDEDGGTVTPPRLLDGGFRPTGLLGMQGAGFTTSTTRFNRYTLAQPLIVPAGKVFVQVSEQFDTATDGTTVALDNGPLESGANWFFNGGGGFDDFAQSDGGVLYNRNWIIRLVLEVPDTAVSVSSVLPSSGPTSSTVPILISGANFEVGATALLGTTTLQLTMSSATQLTGVVPMGTAPGVYDVVVRNPSGTEGRLVNGYQAIGAGGGSGAGGGGGSATGGGSGSDAGTVTLFDIAPAQTYAADDTAVQLTGEGFEAGAQVTIGGKPLSDVSVKSSAVLNATLKANTLGKGLYDVSVLNLSGARATLPMAFNVSGGSAKGGCGCTSVDAPALLAAACWVLSGSRRRKKPAPRVTA
jgi:IPT/TIG domain